MRILIYHTAWLGDIVLATPLISAIKELLPECELYFLTTSVASQLLVGDPKLTGVISVDKRGSERGILGIFKKAAELREYKFDIVISLHKSLRTSLTLYFSRIPYRLGFKKSKLGFLYSKLISVDKNAHAAKRNLQILSGLPKNLTLRGDPHSICPPLKLHIPKVASSSPVMENIQASAGSYIVISPGSSWPTKSWPATSYRELASRLNESPVLVDQKAIVIVGAKSDLPAAEIVTKEQDSAIVNLAGKTTIAELLSIISGASLVVCNDSFALHIAAAFKVPTVAIFCATVPEQGFGPWQNPKSVVLGQPGLWCRPCGRHGAAECPTGSRLCITGVTAGQVIDAIKLLLG